MSLARELAEALARDVLQKMEETGDEEWPERINQTLSASSPTLQEEYLSAIRYLRAEKAARALLEDK